MIRKCVLLFCDNEHGVGDVTFPEIDNMAADQIVQLLVQDRPIGLLRRNAKKAGWGRVNGADYCPGCMESMEVQS